MKKFPKILIFLVLAVFLVAGSAWATPILDFGVITPTSGTISYGGGTAALIGANIEVDNVVGLGTSLNDGVPLVLSNATLDFTTGASNGNWSWGGGESTNIKITGAIPDIGITDSDTILMEGTFGDAEVAYSSGVFKITGGSFTDYKLSLIHI